jgi:hypothetical protein
MHWTIMAQAGRWLRLTCRTGDYFHDIDHFSMIQDT